MWYEASYQHVKYDGHRGVILSETCYAKLRVACVQFAK